MKDVILRELAEIENRQAVKILFAIESGSRAWGFASPDSDYDVRFVYVHPERFYLSIFDHKDFVELPVDEVLDISGWDIRKALRFISSTNVAIYEWYQSPVIYIRHTGFMDSLAAIGGDYFSPRGGMHHYLSLAFNTFEGSLKGESVRLKKYFYALRPILAAEWIARYGTVPPIEFSRLRVMLEDQTIQQEIDAILAVKATADEKYEMAANHILNEYIAERLAHLKALSSQIPKETQPAKTQKGKAEGLDLLFRKMITEAWK